jgi:hypothetical protein
MPPANVMVIGSPDDSYAAICEVSKTVVEVINLVKHHIAAVTTSSLEHSAPCSAFGHGRDDLNKLIPNHHESVCQSEL